MASIPLPPPPPTVDVAKSKPETTHPENQVKQQIKGYNKNKLREVDKNIRGETFVVERGISSYQIPDDEDKKEYFDDKSVVKAKVKQLAEYVKNCKHMISITGAGISTSASIPDFRSPNGIWTKLAQGKNDDTKCPDLRSVDTTVAHQALATLSQADICKMIISTNSDGLHIRSGVAVDKLSELHGSAFKLRCTSCGKSFYTTKGVEQTETYRCICEGTCPLCYNRLRGTGVGFGAELPEDEWKKAKESALKSDLALVLGTSLRVAPACNLVEHSYKNKGHLVIVNLQTTPYDKYAALVIRAKTDYVMKRLMKELQMKPVKAPKHLKLNPDVL